MKYHFDCKDFNGYKPCRPGWTCDGCAEYKPQGFRILIVNLDALGDVLMTTALLPAIKKRYPASTIRWVTSPLAVPLLENNPLVDEIIPYSVESVHYLSLMQFDLIISCDRDRKSAAITMTTPANEKRGFGLGAHGNIIPLNPEFAYAFQLGLDDDLKFKKNTFTGQQILAEGMGFEYERHEYIFELREDEWDHVANYRREMGLENSFKALGINTGCSAKFPNKKLRTDQLIVVIRKMLAHPEADNLRVLLLGGKAETEVNHEIAMAVNDSRVIETPTSEGIRRGLHYIAACDAFLTGDTFGAHAAIALKIPSVVIFTLSCDVEIDMYDRGVKPAPDVPCRPCWKPFCEDPYCLDEINLDDIAAETWKLLA